jgi:putative hydrolase of the HAD superfamily
MHGRAQALLIDGMGTLVALAPPVPRLIEVIERRFGVTVPAPDMRHALGAEIAFYRANMNQGRDEASLAQLRGRCAQVLFGALHRDELADVGDAERTHALMEALRFEPFADARHALATARRHGARVIVVSNWDVSLDEVLERAGLSPLVDGVITSAAVGAPKPEPAIFEHALALAGVGPEQARHVGDSLAEDVAGARAVGIHPILLRRDGSREPGTETVAGLDRLSWPWEPSGPATSRGP